MSYIGYGQALYYPHIHLQSENWLKLAALYYDKLKRIVPKDFETQDSAIVRSLNDEFDFIQNVSPKRELRLYDIAHDFLNFVEKDLSNPQKTEDLFINLRNLFPQGSTVRIHEEKTATMLSLIDMQNLLKKT